MKIEGENRDLANCSISSDFRFTEVPFLRVLLYMLVYIKER